MTEHGIYLPLCRSIGVGAFDLLKMTLDSVAFCPGARSRFVPSGFLELAFDLKKLWIKRISHKTRRVRSLTSN